MWNKAVIWITWSMHTRVSRIFTTLNHRGFWRCVEYFTNGLLYYMLGSTGYLLKKGKLNKIKYYYINLACFIMPY